MIREDYPSLPDFLNRKLNGVTPEPQPTRSVRKANGHSLALQEEAAIASAWSEAEKECIRERFARRRQEIKDRRAERKRLEQNGVTIRLGARLENCPLTPGEHTVELVKRGRKWVRFRCAGRKNCVRVRRVIWDAISGTNSR